MSYKLIINFMLCFVAANAFAQQNISVSGVNIPINSTATNGSTRIGFSHDNINIIYRQYVDRSVVMKISTDVLMGTTYPTYSFRTYELPPSFIIKDLSSSRIMGSQRFVGSYNNIGTCGRLFSMYYASDFDFYYLKLPDMYQIAKGAFYSRYVNNIYPQVIALMIGNFFSMSTRRECLIEMIAEGYGFSFSTPYTYAILPYNSESMKEVADDVIVLGNYFAFATRDTRPGFAPINLRIGEVNHIPTAPTIDIQWQFNLASNENVCSEVRMGKISDSVFAVLYAKRNLSTNKKTLCINRINLHDLFSNNNTIVSHEIALEDGRNYVLKDVIYEPLQKNLVTLLNIDDVSHLYHTDPNKPISVPVYELTPSFQLTSIDTTYDYSNGTGNEYITIGENDVMYQSVLPFGQIIAACPNVIIKDSRAVPPVVISQKSDHLERQYGTLEYATYNCPATLVNQNLNCKIIIND